MTGTSAPTGLRRSRVARALAWSDAWLSAYLPRLRRQRPRVRVQLRPWLPGWVLRCVPAALVVVLANPLDGGPLAQAVIVLLAAAVFGWPAGIAPGAAVIFLGLLFATRAEPPSPLLSAAMVAGLPALVQLGSVIGRTGLTARIELAVLLAPLPRFVVIQAYAQPLALLGSTLAGQNALTGGGAILWPLLAALGLGLISFGWLPRIARGPHRPD